MFSSLRGNRKKDGDSNGDGTGNGRNSMSVQHPVNRLERIKTGELGLNGGSSGKSRNSNVISLVSGSLVIGGGDEPVREVDKGLNMIHSEDILNHADKVDSGKQEHINSGKHQLELTYHDLTRFPNVMIMIDTALIPGLKEGDLCELMNYNKHQKSDVIASNDRNDSIEKKSRKRVKIYFIATKLLTDTNRVQHKSQQLSIASGQLRTLLDLPSRSKVWVKKRSKEACESDLLELNVKDLLINRGDMWCISKQLLDTCVFSGQKLIFSDSLRLGVNGIYRDGTKVLSGYIGENTRIVFRSESARFIFIIQITDEMWNFEESGEQLFQKLINSLFPKIFKKWKARDTHHSITIAFAISMDQSTNPYTDIKPGEKLKTTTDYYRIVVDQVNIINWVQIMEVLRREFMNITEELKNVRVKQENGEYRVIKGRFLPVIKSNFLELVNFATTVLTDPFKQLDLKHTTTHVILISPSSGLYDVDYDLLKLTGKKLMNLEMTMDLICLARTPLHIVPLFRYIDYDGQLHHCTPSWLSIFFWNDSHKNFLDEWQPRCNMYNLRMMGLTENEMLEEVDIPYLSAKNLKSKSIHQLMNNHDRNLFYMKVGNSNEDAMSVYAEGKNELSTNVVATKNGKNIVETSNKLFWNNLQSSVPPTEDIRRDNVMANIYVQNNEDLIADVSDIESNTENMINNSFSNASFIKPNDSMAIESLKHLNKKGSMKNFFSKQLFKKILTTSKEEGNTEDLSTNENTINKESIINDTNIQSNSQKYENTPIIKKNLGTVLTGNDLPTSNNDDSSCRKSVSTQNSSNRMLQSRFTPFYDSSIKPISTQNNKPKLLNQYNSNSTWNEIANPSIPVSNDIAGLFLSKKWRDVLPRFVAKKYSKWRSFTIPAELPLTITSFVDAHEFKSEYEFRNHSVTMNIEREPYNKSSKDLLLNMIYMRLVTGFQICLGDEVEDIEYSMTNDKKSKRVYKYISDENWINTKFYMVLDTEIHRITCGLDGVIDVQRYLKKEQNPLNQVPSYMPLVKTRYEEKYRVIKKDPLHATRKSLNWNQIDQALAGYGDYTENGRHAGFRAKFVVLPVDAPRHILSTVVNGRNETLSPEELRLEGLRRLVSFIARSKVKTQEEKKTKYIKDDVPPEIHFYTGYLINFINEQMSSLNTSMKRDPFFSNPKSLLDKSISFEKLCEHLQHGEDKLNLVTRKWHWSQFKNCFVGSDMVNWLIRNFSDIENREDAISYGQNLIDNKVFVHVLNKHGFLDGHYFYQIAPEYLTEVKALDKPAKESQHIQTSAEEKTTHSIISNTASSISKTLSGGSTDPKSIRENNKFELVLSNSLIIDLDPDGKSYKQETCVVHYDKVHNPDHCFHIRLEWLSATPKLIDDVIKNWSRICEKYGLLLIEVPWEELCSIPNNNPFHTFVEVELAINPWEEPEFNTAKILQKNKFYYHVYLLKKYEFLLDNRAFQFINNDNMPFEMKYSWGKPSFKNAQYIHKSGAYIAEIKDNGDLFLAPNNIFINRTKQSSIINKNKKQIRTQFNAQGVILKFKTMCKDAAKLKDIFEEAKMLSIENEEHEY